MVGLVLISHSAALAQEVAALVHALGFEDVRVLPAGGTSDGRMGTSVDVVSAALRRADDGDGVLLLADLGSAVLTAKLALDEADDTGGDAASRVRLADAPLVEGAVAAAGAIAAGGELGAVADAADAARNFRKI